jgi:hypothetical protein
MKSFLFTSFLIISSLIIGQINPMIDKPYQLGNLDIAEYDFPNKMNWDEAIKACSDLGNGWRLPMIDELEYIDSLNNRIVILGPHWSITWASHPADGTMTNSAWLYMFKLGEQGYASDDYKNFQYFVRAVRTSTN